MKAILRRLLGPVMILLGLVLLFWPTPGIWKLKVVDYGAKYKADVEYANSMARKRGASQGLAPALTQPSAQDLDEYLRRKTGDSLRRVQGKAWEELFDRAAAEAQGVHLPMDTEPMAGLYAPGGRDFFTVELPGKSPLLMQVSLQSPGSSFLGPQVTWGMKRPYSWLSLWLMGAGLLVYAFLPWPRRTQGVYRYSRMRSQIGVDILGMVLAAMFLVLPLLIITENCTHPQPLGMDGGWAVLTWIMWGMALLSASNFAISAWYEELSYQLTARSIIKRTLRGSREYAFEQMLDMHPDVLRAPAWLRAAARIVVLFSLGMAGPILLGSQQVAPLLKVRMKDGETLSIMTKYLVGVEDLEKALLEHGIALAENERD